MEKKVLVSTLVNLPTIAKEVVAFCNKEKKIAFYGHMGVGKTTFIQQFCRALGVQETVSSPTYSLVNEYPLESENGVIYHLDLYRLKDIGEAYDIGIEEYLDSGAYCLIEWPQIIEPLLDKFVKIELKINPDNSRTITISI